MKLQSALKAVTEANDFADVDLLYELGELRHIQRTFRYSVGASSVAEHTLRVCYTAMILARMEKADLLRTLQIALMHDVPEIRTGDPNPWQKPYVTTHTEKAAEDMLTGTTLEDMIPVIASYEKRDSLEAQIVKDADMIECEMEMLELKETGSARHDFFEAQGWMEQVGKNLRTRSGRELYAKVLKRRPIERQAISDSYWKRGKQGT
jgi:putative hydrolase of HD superfamily